MPKFKRVPYPVKAPLPGTSDAKRKGVAAHIDDDTAPQPKRSKMSKGALYEQGCFVIRCRDNLVAGSTGPKDWVTVTHEFNAHFHDDLKVPLAVSTVQKRGSAARNAFQKDFPDYPAPVTYPVPAAADHGDQDGLDVDEEDMGQEKDGRVFTNVADGSKLTSPAPRQAQEELTVLSRIGDIPQPRTQTANAPDTLDVAVHPGAYIPSSISLHHISLIDRVKHHLRQRTHGPVKFNFLDTAEAQLVSVDIQSLDHDTFVSISPFYVRLLRSNLGRSIEVPTQFCTKTINAFIQIVAPIRAKALPTHYLWRSETPVLDMYDRLDAIPPEKIHWSVDNLLELHTFAHYMEVYWVGNMVIDRLHWMLCEQMQLRKVCQNINAQYGWIEHHGKKQFFGEQLPEVSNLDTCALSADEFDTLALDRFATSPLDVPTMTFYADLITALHDAPVVIWLGKVPQEAQDICIDAAATPRDLTGMSREQFCSRYHNHAAGESCYTAGPDCTAQYLIRQLCATSLHNELPTPSLHISSRINLTSIMYGASGAPTTLEMANISPDMVEAENMVMEMERRLEKAKAALQKARTTGHQAKNGTILVAKNAAEQFTKPFNMMRN